MGENMEKTGIFIDYDNVYITLEQYYETVSNDNLKTIIIEKIREHFKGNKILSIKAFADFQKINMALTVLQKNQVELRHVYSSNDRKNASDIALAISVIKSIYSQEHIDKYVIVSSDSDMLPIINEITYFDKGIFVIYSEFGSKEGYDEYLSKEKCETIEKILNLTPYKPIEDFEITGNIIDYLENINEGIRETFNKYSHSGGGTTSKKDVFNHLYNDRKLNLVKNNISIIIENLLKRKAIKEIPSKIDTKFTQILIEESYLTNNRITLRSSIVKAEKFEKGKKVDKM